MLTRRLKYFGIGIIELLNEFVAVRRFGPYWKLVCV